MLEFWKFDLVSCDKIFIRVFGGNKRLFLYGKFFFFNKDDERVRMVFFSIRRFTLNEVRRVFEMWFFIECYGNGIIFFFFLNVFCVLVVYFFFIILNLLVMIELNVFV